MAAEWFWLVMVVACLGWYSAVTLYVAVKGAGDIRVMLDRLGGERKLNDEIAQSTIDQ